MERFRTSRRTQPTGSDFGRVYDEHLPGVYGFIAYRSADRQLAEDLTQATFERALRHWPRYDPTRASQRTWLLIIARSVLIDHHRRQREDAVAAVDERRLESVPGPDERPQVSPALEAALGQLADRDQEVIALRYAGDLSGQEIASLLDLSLANVQQILSRSLRRLRASLEIAGATPGEPELRG